MLAEIFIMRLETLLRVTAANAPPTSSDTRFVPIKLPPETPPETPRKAA
jgi:hypothetical protein